MAHWSLQNAKTHFSEVVTAARRAPQTITKRGKPIVVVINVELFERQFRKRKPTEAGKQRSFVEHLLAMPKGGDFDFDRTPHEPRDIDL
jgi:antitoxin Phd